MNEPIVGYYKDPIGTLDWMALYPSLMLGHNLCHSTHVLDPRLRGMEGVASHPVRKLGSVWRQVSSLPAGAAVVDGALAEQVRKGMRASVMTEEAVEDSRSGARSCGEGRTFEVADQGEGARTQLTPDVAVRLGESEWAVPEGGHTTYFQTRHRGILPRILETLLRQRSQYKKEVKRHLALAKEASSRGDEKAAKYHRSMASVNDGHQLAVKVSANSVYGSTGAGKAGKIPNKDISETVTFQGRDTMDILKGFLAEHFPAFRVIYGDTDSVMLQIRNVSDPNEAATVFAKAADDATRFFADNGFPSMVLEFEKVYFPFVLLKKKRYLALKFEPTDDGPLVCKGVDAKGVETERKDTLPFLKEVYLDVRNALLYKLDEHLALEELRRNMQRLVRNEVPFESLMLSKGLRATYKDRSTQVQCCVNDKKRLRQEGSQTAVGDRVWYVMVNGPKDAKATDLAEDPAYVKEHGLRLNLLWYFDHKIRPPLESLFKVIPALDVRSVMEATHKELERERLGVKRLSDDLFMEEGGEEEEEVVHVPREPPPRPSKRKAAARR